MLDIAAVSAVFAVFYFWILKPMRDEEANRKQLITTLQKDDRVVAAGGIHGRIVKVEEQTLVLEFSEKYRVTVDKESVSRKLS